MRNVGCAIFAVIFVMFVSLNAIESLKQKVRLALRSVTEIDGIYHKAQVCIICDIFLDTENADRIPLDRLKNNKGRLLPFGKLPSSVTDYYKYKGKGHKTWMDDLLLSPKATHFGKSRAHNKNAKVRRSTSESFTCCSRCKKSLEQQSANPPKFAIVNGFAIGMPESFLEDLNDIELALVSLNRNMSHVFSLFGGQHKQMKGFHTMMKSNVTHTSTSLSTIKKMTGKNNITCVLSGPFTDRQRKKAEEATSVSAGKVIEAYNRLHDQNHLYNALPVPAEEDIPEPIVVDDR